MARITEIGAGAAAKVCRVVVIAFSFIAGAILLVTYFAGGGIWWAVPGDEGIAMGLMIVFSLVMLPGVLGMDGIIIGALCAWIYNLTARWHGGFVLTLKQES